MSRLPLHLNDQSLGPTGLGCTLSLFCWHMREIGPPEEHAALEGPEPQRQLICSCKFTSEEHPSNLNAFKHRGLKEGWTERRRTISLHWTACNLSSPCKCHRRHTKRLPNGLLQIQTGLPRENPFSPFFHNHLLVFYIPKLYSLNPKPGWKPFFLFLCLSVGAPASLGCRAGRPICVLHLCY